MKAKAEAEALTLVAEALKETTGGDAAKLQIAKQYIEMYAEMGKASNTMLFSDRPADVNALIGQVGSRVFFWGVFLRRGLGWRCNLKAWVNWVVAFVLEVVFKIQMKF